MLRCGQFSFAAAPADLLHDAPAKTLTQGTEQAIFSALHSATLPARGETLLIALCFILGNRGVAGGRRRFVSGLPGNLAPEELL